jgi:hypothetical protein
LNGEAFVFAAVNREARDNRARTLDRTIAVQEIRAHAVRAAKMLEAQGLQRARCWGSIPSAGNLHSWRRMRPGDWGLLYAGDGQFPLLLRVTSKGRFKKLARHLWSRNNDGETWELMYFFDTVLEVDLEIGAVREAFDLGKDWWPQGLQYFAPARQDMLMEKFGSVEGFAAASASGSSVTAKVAPSPEELLFGGRFGGVPSKPPKARRQRSAPDPDIAGRGYMAHEETVAKLEKHIGRSAFYKGKRGINHDGAWTVAGHYCICEVKSITAANEVTQLQKGLGQLLHNRFKARWNRVKRVRAYLIAEREPSGSELWRTLAAEHDIVFTWPERFGEDVRKP